MTPCFQEIFTVVFVIKKKTDMKIEKAFYGSFSYLNGKTREQWDQIVYNQTYLSFIKGRDLLSARFPGQPVPICSMTRTGTVF